MIDFLKVYYNYIPVAVLAGIFVDLIVGDCFFTASGADHRKAYRAFGESASKR